MTPLERTAVPGVVCINSCKKNFPRLSVPESATVCHGFLPLHIERYDPPNNTHDFLPVEAASETVA